MRVENGGTRYFSFQELPGVSKTKKTTEYSDKEKEKFVGVCNVCKQPMHFVKGTNVIACDNPSCKGFKHVTKDSDGNEIVSYSPVFRTLTEKNMSYAERLFKEDK